MAVGDEHVFPGFLTLISDLNNLIFIDPKSLCFDYHVCIESIFVLDTELYALGRNNELYALGRNKNVMLCYVMLCYVMLCYVMLCCVVLCCVML